MRRLSRVYLNEIKKMGNNGTRSFYQVIGNYNFIVYLEIDNNEFAGYRFEKDNNDDFIKMREQSIFLLSDGVMIKQFDMTLNSSNKEFAVSARRPGGTSVVWLPEHSGVGTAYLGNDGVRELVVDNEIISLTSNTSLISFSKASFHQKMIGVLPDNENPVAEINLMTVFLDNALEQSFTLKFLEDIFVGSAYIFMVPLLSEYLTSVSTNRREVVNADTEDLDTETEFVDLDVRKIYATSNKTGKENYYYEQTITEESAPFENLFLQHRTGGELQKLYPYYHKEQDFPAESVIYADATIKIGKLKNAHKAFT